MPVSKEHLQPIRFQGQSFDVETGLHYNRFRYFDPDLGMFTTRDPIGLLGGSNVFAYAPNPTGWIDPKRFELPQIHSPEYKLSDKHLEQMANDQLDPQLHKNLVNGFGIRSKSHPDRLKYTGTLDQAYIDSGKSLPEDFDFAIWNSAYPDQQVDEIRGDEWIILTNLCRADTKAARKNDNGDTILNLYLPETLTYLVTVPVDEKEMAKTQAKIKIDTVVISPDEQKVNIVWRSTIKADEAPQHLMLEMMNREDKEAILSQYFTQKGEVVRPYALKTDGGMIS